MSVCGSQSSLSCISACGWPGGNPSVGDKGSLLPAEHAAILLLLLNNQLAWTLGCENLNKLWTVELYPAHTAYFPALFLLLTGYLMKTNLCSNKRLQFIVQENLAWLGCCLWWSALLCWLLYSVSSRFVGWIIWNRWINRVSLISGEFYSFT